jgi:NTP pyrophosphatase (non-canonical NTP hydrolase)
MEQLIQQIQTLSKVRIKKFIEKSDDNRYKGSQTYFEKLHEEITEAQAENKDHNQVYLEDELGDVFWDYMMLVHALESEGKISSVEKVFARCYKKFSERIGEDGENI